MYLGFDIGATKTLVAVFTVDGRIVSEQKFPTPKDYAEFLVELGKVIAPLKKDYQISYTCSAVPGKIDRLKGIGLVMGNLPWTNVPIQKDLEALTDVPVLIENDTKLAALSEALLYQGKYKNILYLTVSTGISMGVIINGKIDEGLADSEPGQMVLEHNGKLQQWEDFASGKAFKTKYGKLASEVTDPEIWREYVKSLAPGIGELAAIVQPDIIIMGGGMGGHFDKYSYFLKEELKKYANDMVPIPPMIKAQKPEEAVIYGCYDFIRQKLA